MGSEQAQSMDFKYILQDFSWYYIGLRMTYNELAEQEDTPSRFRSAIFRYMDGEIDFDETLAGHLVSADKKSRSVMIYEQLKAEITLLPAPEKGREKQQILKAEEWFADDALRQNTDPSELSELRFKKRNLMFLRI
ncbi:MAG: hypothetical protein K6E18_09925 [Lachnospiraceae bacterium]|nr:hypothetical protein [Lachnospiraceae bacterium]